MKNSYKKKLYLKWNIPKIHTFHTECKRYICTRKSCNEIINLIIITSTQIEWLSVLKFQQYDRARNVTYMTPYSTNILDWFISFLTTSEHLIVILMSVVLNNNLREGVLTIKRLSPLQSLIFLWQIYLLQI